MSTRYLHIVCAALLTLFPHLMLQSCSSAQQQDGDLESEQGVEGNEEANINSEEGNVAEEGEEGENVAMEEGDANDGENFDNEGGEQLAENSQLDNQVLEGNQTQSNLEEIIAGQDAEQPTEAMASDASAMADMGADAAATEALIPDAQANAGSMAAPAMAMAPALPEQGSKMPYIVRVGDSLSSIAKMIYGSSDRWSEMAELSSIKNPNLVRPGDVVYYQLTQETLAFATAYEGAPRNELTVQPGDTLAAIAMKVYGNQGDWKFVWRQNAEIENPDRLEVGQTIYYLSPAAFGAAFEYAKSVTIADLLKKFDNAEQTNNTDNNETVSSTIELEASNADYVTGFEMAKTMFNTFSANLGITG